ncbi:MAG: hypothetical protein IE909_10655 [Campylobacterales bacterium]|nr:hypothetical protein [Campylobacterales bacterium]
MITQEEVLKDLEELYYVAQSEDDEDISESTRLIDLFYKKIGFKNGFYDAEDMLHGCPISNFLNQKYEQIDAEVSESELKGVLIELQKNINEALNMDLLNVFRKMKF